MQLKLGQLDTVNIIIGGLIYNDDGSKVKLPIRPAYFISKFIKQLANELQQFHEARLQLCEKYCKRDKNGDPVIITDANNSDYTMYDFTGENKVLKDKEFADLCEGFIEIPFDPIKIDDLGDISIAPPILQALFDFGFLIEEEACKKSL